MSGPDLDSLVALDVHVHVQADQHGHLALDDELNAAAAKYFKGDPYDPTVPEIAADYRKLRTVGRIDAHHIACRIFRVGAQQENLVPPNHRRGNSSL